jgi:hypothetical protein
MRRPARRLFTLCSGVSLVLCTAVCVLWVRSYWRCDLYARDAWPRNEGIVVGSNEGRLVFRRDAILPPSSGIESVTELVGVLNADAVWFEQAGNRNFESRKRDYLASGMQSAAGYRVGLLWRMGRYWDVVVGHWVPAALFGAIAGATARPGFLRRRRRAAGRCPTCGYDLRATPGRCPECGTAAAAAASTAEAPAAPPG